MGRAVKTTISRVESTLVDSTRERVVFTALPISYTSSVVKLTRCVVDLSKSFCTTQWGRVPAFVALTGRRTPTYYQTEPLQYILHLRCLFSVIVY